eukprot:TRINITY_DN9493_c0_g1_i4.p1 TRINITY_DN9493_c0_g1~~TRINITY_DN9493_c0_g1_i4.p1  ORF type:complete len:567 (-),score=107.77 TRINITY_DN9493_c0_g1_i4:80-1780(-)
MKTLCVGIIVTLCFIGSSGHFIHLDDVKPRFPLPPIENEPQESTTKRSVLQGDQNWPLLDSIINTYMNCTQIKGLAIVVTKGDDVVYKRTLGYSDVSKATPVQSNTIFSVGSLSKSVSSAVFAWQHSKGLVDWIGSIHDYIPDWKRPSDVASSKLTTPLDVASMRVGFDTENDFFLLAVHDYFEGRESSFRNMLHYLPQYNQFRSGWLYSNIGYNALQYASEYASGMDWTTLTGQVLFTPLNMSSTFVDAEGPQGTGRLATGYSHDDLGNQVPTPFQAIRNIAPASSGSGGVFSTIDDMSNYIRFFASKTYAPSVIPRQHLSFTWQRHTPLNIGGFTTSNGFPVDFVPFAYGAGWIPSVYNKRIMNWHNGEVPGQSSIAAFLPSEKIGVVILTNLEGLGGDLLFPMMAALDVAVGDMPWVPSSVEESCPQSPPVPTSSPTSPPTDPVTCGVNSADYVGSYKNKAYGIIEVGVNSESFLTLKYGNNTWCQCQSQIGDNVVFACKGLSTVSTVMEEFTFSRNTLKPNQPVNALSFPAFGGSSAVFVKRGESYRRPKTPLTVPFYVPNK